MCKSSCKSFKICKTKSGEELSPESKQFHNKTHITLQMKPECNITAVFAIYKTFHVVHSRKGIIEKHEAKLYQTKYNVLLVSILNFIRLTHVFFRYMTILYSSNKMLSVDTFRTMSQQTGLNSRQQLVK